ncbi:MAG: flagellar FliJ family protein [Alphaproteobacteria bacterium]|nr:flagellar FliJ family protein [Alphaproteobacteria bacterium]
MKTLGTLIRMAKFEVDERRRSLSVILEREAEFHRRLAALDAEFERERDLARASPELARNFGVFADRHKRRRAVVENRIAALQPAIVKARDDLAEAFETQKRYEITRDRNQEEAAAEEKRVEQAELDDLTSVRASRETPF